MWRRFWVLGVGARRRWGRPAAGLAFCVALVLAAAPRPAAQPAPAENAMPAMDNAMSSAGWLQNAFLRLEQEARSDIGMLPDAPGALAREWRTFDRQGSPSGALVNVGWVVLAACLALLAERGVSRGLGRRARRALRLRPEGPTLGMLVSLLACDVAGIVVFAGVFVYLR